MKFQAAASNLPNFATDPVVRDLSDEFRPLSGVGINDELTRNEGKCSSPLNNKKNI